MILDCHTHSSFSPDAEDGVAAMAARAAELGLKVYAVTDHCECNRFYGEEHYEKIERGQYGNKELAESSLRAILEVRERLKGDMKLLAGVELGQATFDEEAAGIVTSNDAYDVIIGSMHQIPDLEDFCFIDPADYDVDKAVEQYFAEVYKMCREIDFDVLAHLTYPLRYIEGNYGVKVNISRCDDIIEEILKHTAQNGRALEINTSGLRQSYGKTFPEPGYVKLFKELGGEFITFGSDAHRASDLGKGIETAEAMAVDAGFRYAAYFEKREPRTIALN